MTRVKKLIKATTVLFAIIIVSISNFSSEYHMGSELVDEDQSPIENPISSGPFDDGILFSGGQDAMSVNETALYTQSSQFTIGNGSNPMYTSENESLIVDTVNNWQGYKYSAELSGISDENDWIINGNFGSDDGITYSAHNAEIFQSAHPYSNNLDSDPSIGGNLISTIDGSGCDYMRLHFANISTEPVYDILYLWNQDNNFLEWYSGSYDNLTTQWFEASTVKITMETNTTVNGYGFYIDYFETYNGILFTVDSDNWTPYESIYYTSNVEANAVVSHQLNNSAVNITLVGEHVIDDDFKYYRLDSSGIYQELIIPRGEVIDAWFSMDYNMLRGIDNNEMIIYFMINDDIVYSRGFHTITTEGIAQWQSTGVIPLSSSIFSGNLNDQIINISIGVQATRIKTYSGEHANLQEIYFDNIKLYLKAEVNGTDPNVDLKIEDLPVIDSPVNWGESTLTMFNTWNENPIHFNLTTNAIKIEFTLNSTLYGCHLGNSTLEEYGSQGSNVIIYTNNSVYWETYFRTYIPLYYVNYAFTGIKPEDWEIKQIIDPTGTNTGFLDGQRGSESFTVDYPDANYPGWWNFIAKSTNMINASSTSFWNGTDWQHYLDPMYFNISNTVRIKSSLNTSLGTIENIASTTANLTIYDPEGELWFNGGVTPESSGDIQFPDLTIGQINSSAGQYQFRIFWANGTSAGGINGSFYVYRNLQATLLFPRDAVEDFEIEAVLGDIIPLRIKLNDSLSGDLATNMEVIYSWESGSDNLIEIISGNYDGNFDTLELVTPGIHELNFTIWGFGFYNLTFTLTINLVEETELRIVGLDNNIDYGTNFSIRISYTSKHLSYGIPDAEVVLNLSSSFYTVTDSVEDGKYDIEISSKDAFSGAGSYDIQINASATNFQAQDLVTRIQVLPRSVYFEIFIDSNDVSFNKSYYTHVKQILNISVGVKASSDDQPIFSGTVQLFDGHLYSDPFSVVGNYYFMEINSSQFGLGVHFISIIFNETTYQSASEIIMLSITRLPMIATLYDTDPVLSVDQNSQFEVLIYVEDPITHLPITDVVVAFDWIFGRGFLTNLGNGFYKFEESAPRETQSYLITFTINSPNVDYEPSTIEVILVSLPLDYPNLWWILSIVGSIALITTGILVYLVYRRNVIIPRQRKEVDLLRKKTQVFDDITNIKSILIIETYTGRLMYRHIIGGLDTNNEDIFSGFLHAILTLSNRFGLQNGELGERQEYAEFTHEAFHVLVAAGKKVIIALILEEESSEELQKRAFKFLDEFEGIYASILEKWNGDRTVFNATTPKLFEEIFHLSLLKRFKLTEADNIHLIEKALVYPDTISEKVSQIIKTVSEERNDFRLRTLISLISKEEQLQAKDVILRFIKNKYLVPVD